MIPVESETEPEPETGDLSVFDRMTAAGISADRIEHHLDAGRVTVDGVVATDPQHPAPPPARIVIAGS